MGSGGQSGRSREDPATAGVGRRGLFFCFPPFRSAVEFVVSVVFVVSVEFGVFFESGVAVELGTAISFCVAVDVDDVGVVDVGGVGVGGGGAASVRAGPASHLSDSKVGVVRFVSVPTLELLSVLVVSVLFFSLLLFVAPSGADGFFFSCIFWKKE